MPSTRSQASTDNNQLQETEQQFDDAGQQGQQRQGQMQNQDQPGLIGSHAQYIKGAAVQGVGNLTGSRDWQTSGQQEKEDAVAQMRQVGEERDPAKQGYGRAEEIAGRALGCEGMEQEGQQSRRQ